MKNKFLSRILCFILFLAGGFVFAQGTISGTVSDAAGPLPGVNIIVKGTTNGTQSDFDGKYTLDNVASDAVIVFSYIGFKTQEVAVDGRSTIDITLEEDAAQLAEVVVVGYGNQERKEITTAVTSVSEEEFNQGVINNASQLLQGKVAGLSIYNKGGDPNSNGTIRLRGLSTVGGNTEPLVVIDGVLGQSLNNVDPSDIKNITVLKDGSAAAIYGSRASSGVILVTTKSGRSNQAFTVDYNGQYGVSTAVNSVDIMNRQEFLAVGGTDLGSNTNWLDEVTRSALSQVHNIAASGGSENSNYRVAFNYRDTEGILINSGFEQTNVRANFQGRLFDDKLRINFNSAFTQRDSEFGFTEALRYAVQYNPTAPIFGADAPFAFNSEQFGGYFETLGLFDSFNPVSIAEQNRNGGTTTTVNYNVDFKYSITDDLTATLNIGNQVSKTQNNQYYPVTSFFRGGALSPFRKGRVDFYTNEARTKTLELYGTYNASLNDEFIKMKFDGGYSFQENDFNDYYLQLGDFPPGLNFNFSNQIEASQDLQEAGRVIANSSRNDDDRIIAFFLRGNFTIDDAIYVNASVRHEGSSRFGEDNQWGTFPSVAVGADLNNYLQLDNVTLLKARLGYGVTGAIPPGVGLSQTTFGVLNGTGGFGSTGPNAGTRAPNPDLKWEEKREINLGFEFAMDRFSATLDLYNRDIVDFITEVNVDAAVFGFPTQFQNSGELQTQGIELSVNYDILRNEDWNYNMGFVGSTYQTTLEKNTGGDRVIANLGAPGQNDTEVILVREGEEVGQIWGPVFTGEVDANGTPILADVNGDGNVVTDQGSALAEDGDFAVLGKGFPDFELGWTHRLEYKNWDLNAFFRGAFGHSLVNTFRVFYEPRIGSQSSYNFVNTELARNDIRTAQFSSYYVEKADFLRLDNLTVGYTFDINDDSFIKSARVAITAQNLFTITGYTGSDPEPAFQDRGAVDNGGTPAANPDVLAPGIDRRYNYFQNRTFTLGLNVKF